MARFLFSIALCIVSYGMAMAQQSGNICSNSKIGFVQHEKYCDYYYRCDRDGHPVEEACPNGLVYVGKGKGPNHSVCDYPHVGNCPDVDGRVMGQQPISSDNCAWQYGIFPHETSCTRYWQCWNGTSTMQQCPVSLLYNEKIHSCDWPDNVPDCQKHPLCKDELGNVPFGNSCDQYWLCIGGYPRKQNCPAGLAFNKDLRTCENAATVPGCEPKPAPLDEDDDAGELQPPSRQ